jgi:hypothetical protein
VQCYVVHCCDVQSTCLYAEVLCDVVIHIAPYCEIFFVIRYLKHARYIIP